MFLELNMVIERVLTPGGPLAPLVGQYVQELIKSVDSELEDRGGHGDLDLLSMVQASVLNVMWGVTAGQRDTDRAELRFHEMVCATRAFVNPAGLRKKNSLYPLVGTRVPCSYHAERTKKLRSFLEVPLMNSSN